MGTQDVKRCDICKARLYPWEREVCLDCLKEEVRVRVNRAMAANKEKKQ
jgi:RecJ-like exonuclease